MLVYVLKASYLMPCHTFKGTPELRGYLILVLQATF